MSPSSGEAWLDSLRETTADLQGSGTWRSNSSFIVLAQLLMKKTQMLVKTFEVLA